MQCRWNRRPSQRATALTQPWQRADRMLSVMAWRYESTLYIVQEWFSGLNILHFAAFAWVAQLNLQRRTFNLGNLENAWEVNKSFLHTKPPGTQMKGMCPKSVSPDTLEKKELTAICHERNLKIRVRLCRMSLSCSVPERRFFHEWRGEVWQLSSLLHILSP
ncbi:hypothetical protein CEXT_201781 [Caerostris extrusa]|uniref:Uncharacterized protein n=1 Tax=Caerostris extrusa TaxID=172846 RepID=A0AAV4V2P4_CAEEX|nr:hypothetical protein CEXT_201781 [Caerostris extrusa]